MKILFYYRGRESLAIGYLAAVLKQAGHTVDLIFDPGLGNTNYYRNRWLNIFSDEDSLVERAVNFSPQLIAFSATTNEYPYVVKMARKLKEKVPAPVIVGGIHPTALPEFVLSNPDIDMICRGEGEFALLELVDKMSQGRDFYQTRNIWFKKKNGQIIRNELRPLVENLDLLPFPDKELFFQYGCGKDVISVISSRGCFFQCSYCIQHFWRDLYKGKGEYIRRRTVKNLILELKLYKEKYRAKEISFEDDLFVTDKQWLKEFTRSYTEEINLPFFCNISPTLIDDETAVILKEAGCNHLYVGIDSASESIRTYVAKRNTPQQQIRKNINIVKKHGLNLELSMIFGWPNESPADMWAGVELMDELQPKQVQTHILYPYPGTEMLKFCQEGRFVDDKVLTQIYQGQGGMVVESILKHPHKDMAYVMMKLLPIYIKTPRFLKFLIKPLINPMMKRLANIIYIPAIPFVYPLLAWTRIREIRSMMLVAVKTRLFAVIFKFKKSLMFRLRRRVL